MQVRELNDKEMTSVNGGSGFSSAIINAVVNAVNTIFELGRQLGSSIRRFVDGNYCNM